MLDLNTKWGQVDKETQRRSLGQAYSQKSPDSIPRPSTAQLTGIQLSLNNSVSSSPGRVLYRILGDRNLVPWFSRLLMNLPLTVIQGPSGFELCLVSDPVVIIMLWK